MWITAEKTFIRSRQLIIILRVKYEIISYRKSPAMPTDVTSVRDLDSSNLHRRSVETVLDPSFSCRKVVGFKAQMLPGAR